MSRRVARVKEIMDALQDVVSRRSLLERRNADIDKKLVEIVDGPASETSRVPLVVQLVQEQEAIARDLALLDADERELEAQLAQIVDGERPPEDIAADIINLDAPLEQRVVALMKKRPTTAWRVGEVADLLAVDPRTVSVALGRLLKKGDVQKLARGQFRLRAHGRKTLTPKRRPTT